ncbi:MAG: enoyl-CoA hydratase/isomerase family protein [Candidatus Rokubacteria bacterium]|nr:enoyl-CoA hydratase/isomerase family protein [Candidatus Rokubacteria bacterium]
MTLAHVTLERQGWVATLTLNRPDRRNSLSDPLLEDLISALEALRDDASSRVVVVTGADPVFSAGADAPGMKASMTPEERRRVFGARTTQFRRLFERVTTLLENLEQVTLAAVNGHAVGGGWGLCLACDFRIVSEEAQFWIPEVDLGVPLGVASTARFVRLAGEALAKEIILGGRRYSAAEAKAMGLVHQVVPGAELAKTAREYAERLAAKPFRPLAQVKANINAIARAGNPEVLAVTEGFLRRDA